jgi:hypothetical protein
MTSFLSSSSGRIADGPAGSRIRAVGVVWVIVGGMIVLQSSPSLDLPKLIYLGGAGVGFLISLFHVWRQTGTPEFEAMNRWLVLSAIAFALLALSLPVAIVGGTGLTEWVRDAGAYGLLAAAPLFAMSAYDAIRRDRLVAMFVLLGAFGGLAYMLRWMELRSIAVIPFSIPILPTWSMPMALIAFGVAASLTTKARWRWAALSGLILGAFVATASRASLLLLAPTLVVAVIGRRFGVRRVAAVAVPQIVFALGLALAVQTAVGWNTLGLPGWLATAPRSTPTPQASSIPSSASTASGPPPGPTVPPVSIGGRVEEFISNPAADISLNERIAQYRAAWQLFLSSPIVGVGPGHPIEWTRADGTRYVDFTADTPVVLLAKFGLAGLAVLIVAIWAWVSTTKTLLRQRPLGPAGVAFAGFGALVAVLAWSSFVAEDKGFSFAMIFYLALALHERMSAGDQSSRGATLATET